MLLLAEQQLTATRQREKEARVDLSMADREVSGARQSVMRDTLPPDDAGQLITLLQPHQQQLQKLAAASLLRVSDAISKIKAHQNQPIDTSGTHPCGLPALTQGSKPFSALEASPSQEEATSTALMRAENGIWATRIRRSDGRGAMHEDSKLTWERDTERHI